jgi:hypothetical protein
VIAASAGDAVDQEVVWRRSEEVDGGATLTFNRDGDDTRGNDGTSDGDHTRGEDGTSGGDNTATGSPDTSTDS